jgi:dUTP pyrophosphatase
MEYIEICVLSRKAKIPIRSSEEAAGFDLFSAENLTIPAKERILCKTDILMALPPNTYGRIAPRSGLAIKHSIDIGGGVVDRDYRGNVTVIMINFGENDFIVKIGDRIAQLIVERIVLPEILIVQPGDLIPTKRNANGFGSTGH